MININCSKILRILIVTTLIGGLLATAAPSHPAHWGSKQKLVKIASRNLVPEIRAGASLALTWRLTEDCGEIAEDVIPMLRAGPEKPQALLEELERIKAPEEEFLQKLEEIATGPTPELRRAAINPLASCSYPFYLLVSGLSGLLQKQLPIKGLTGKELVASIPEGESFELRLARAIAIVRHLWSANPCQLPVADLVTRKLRILQGGSVKFCGFQLDGSIPAIREAFLFGTKVFSYRYHSVMDFPSPPGYPIKNRLGCDGLMEGSVNGQTPQFRAAMASAYLDFCLQKPTLANLQQLAVTGESGELRKAAAAKLIDLLVGSHIDDSQLEQIALSGESPELRWAAGMALGVRWAREAEEGNLRLSDIPRKSSTSPYSLKQALIIFAAENTAIHPGLAQASVYPLATLFTGKI